MISRVLKADEAAAKSGGRNNNRRAPNDSNVGRNGDSSRFSGRRNGSNAGSKGIAVRNKSIVLASDSNAGRSDVVIKSVNHKNVSSVDNSNVNSRLSVIETGTADLTIAIATTTGALVTGA